VKFFHFTQSRHLASIQKQGLVPSSRSFGFVGDVDIPTPPYFPIVWLTQTQVKTAADVFVETVVKHVRIKIELPIKTKELWHWATWLERYDPYYLRLLNTPNPGGLWAYHWFFTGVITPDKFRGIDANPVDRREVSDERRQELLALSARHRRLIRGMLGQGYRARDYSVIRKRVSTSPSKIRFR
jgi:hypothetical protein